MAAQIVIGARSGWWTACPRSAGRLPSAPSWSGSAGHPELPPPVLLDRDRAGTYLAVAAAVVGSFGLFLLLTYYLQVVRGYSPVRTGPAFL